MDHETLWLLSKVTGQSPSDLRLRPRPLTEAEQATFDEYRARRAQGEPLQYILGDQPFLNLTLRVTPAVLIPRPETELLVEQVAQRLGGTGPVADLGTGSGCIALGLKHLRPELTVYATEISPKALAVAKENGERLNLEVTWLHGDYEVPVEAVAREATEDARYFAALVSNPPYVSEEEYAGLQVEVKQEPKLALVPPGDDVLYFYRRLARASRLLRPGGFLAAEVGHTQAEAVAALFAEVGLATEIISDYSGISRMVFGYAGRGGTANENGDS